MTVNNTDIVKVSVFSHEKASKLFSTQHAFTGQSCICSSELTAPDSITQLLLTALTYTSLVNIQGAEGEMGQQEELGVRAEEEKAKCEKRLRVKVVENTEATRKRRQRT